MSTPASDRHPLDTDLLDLVEGALDPNEARSVEEHLAGCVLCRIKRQRLTDQPPITFTGVRDVAIPSFGAVATVDAPLSTVQAGELWLTGGDEAVMVLVRRVLDSGLGLVVVPVTFDVEVADNGTLVLAAQASPLGVPLAIYDGMLSGLPVGALSSRVATIHDVDLLNVIDGDPGVTRGSALEGPGDPRHEVRQYVADRLTRLSPLEDDEDDEYDELPPAAGAGDFAIFRRELNELRSEGLTVEQSPILTSCPDAWVGLGQVLRRHQTVGVIGTPAGLVSDADFVAARSLVLRWHLSALVVCPRDGEIVDLYPPEALYDGYDVPSGNPGRRPFIGSHGLSDSVRKFLGDRDKWNVPFASETGQVERVDVPELLSELALKAATDLGTGNFRGEKREGWRRAANRGAQLAAVLRTAADGTFDLSKVTDIANEDET